MRPLIRFAVAASVIAISALVVAPAMPAYADAPTLAVSDVTLTPLAIGADGDAPIVDQTITWSNLPPLTVLQYRVPQDLGMIGRSRPTTPAATAP